MSPTCAFHPRLRKRWRKVAMALLAVLLIGIWVTLAFTKLHALIFVCVVLAVGLSLRRITQMAARRRPKPSLLRQAIMEQLPLDALAKPKILLATAGSDQMADSALEIAKAENAAMIVCFIREVALSYKVEAEQRLTLDTDPAAQAMFTDFLAHGHKYGVPIIPVYDTGHDGAELIAEQAAMNGAHKVLIGSSRRGALHHLIKGSFQRRLEAFLPPDVRVQVLADGGTTPPAAAA
jgi:nucleotide-binding universal stress UspA family protein